MKCLLLSITCLWRKIGVTPRTRKSDLHLSLLYWHATISKENWCTLDWKLCHETPLWRKTIIVIGHSVQLQWEGISFSVLSWNLLTMSYYLEKEEWKYCSILKLVHYWILHNGLFFLDGPLEVSNPNCLFGQITPYGGILTMGTLESLYLFHVWLGQKSWNIIKWFINSGILNFSGRTMVLVKLHIYTSFLVYIHPFLKVGRDKKLHIIIILVPVWYFLYTPTRGQVIFLSHH